MRPIERAVWELHRGSDLMRAQYNIMRILYGLEAADLLIAHRPYPGLVREPDYTCECAEKHKPPRITNHCPVLRKLYGVEAGAEYFAINRDRLWRTEDLWLPFGHVPLSRIMKY